MSMCACFIDMNINIGDDSCVTVEIEGFEKAIKDTQCYECSQVVPQGGNIYMEIIAPRNDEHLKYNSTIYTCPSCLSIRRELFCSFCYGRLIGDLEDYLVENNGHIPEKCMAELIPEARKKVLSMIDEYFAQDEDEDW